MSEELERITKLGAEARAHGRSFLDNPYLKAENCPSITQEPISLWRSKHDAWDIGWRSEDLMKGTTP